MAPVIIKTHAFHDPRFAVAGRTLRMREPAVAWKLALCWSYAIQMRSTMMALDQIAACIGRNAEVVQEALILADLARPVGLETLDLAPLRSLFEGLEECRDHSRTVQGSEPSLMIVNTHEED